MRREEAILDWEKLDQDEIATEFDKRNGMLQQMRGFFAMMRNLPFLIKDKRNRVLWANQAGESLLGMRLHNLRGHKVSELLPNSPEWKDSQKEINKVVQTKAARFQYHPGLPYATIRIPFYDEDGDMIIMVMHMKA